MRKINLPKLVITKYLNTKSSKNTKNCKSSKNYSKMTQVAILNSTIFV